MKIHNVFHISLLRRYNEDPHGRKPERPPPIVTEEGEEEWEVEKILNSRIYKQGRGKRLQFLVKWKGYSDKWNK